MSIGISGKVIIITGASSGLGEATARLLAREGAKLVLGARRKDRLDTLQHDLAAGGAEVVTAQTDVTRYAEVEALVDAALKAFGRVDVLINNAGLMPNSPLERRKVDDWDQMIDVNIKGVLYGISAVLPTMQAQKSGQIINVSSIAGHRVIPGSTVYCSTKSAVRVITEGLRQEVKPHNIRTTIISPGAVATELPLSITEVDVQTGMSKFYEDVALPAETFARVVAFAISQPEDVDINEVLFRPTAQMV